MTVGGLFFFFKFSRKLVILGTIWTPVKDFLHPIPPSKEGGRAFFRGGGACPHNCAPELIFFDLIKLEKLRYKIVFLKTGLKFFTKSD